MDLGSGGVDLAVGWWPGRAWPGRGGSLERASLRAASISQMVIPGIHFDQCHCPYLRIILQGKAVSSTCDLS